MRLIELDPRWYSTSGDVHHGMTFNCPHCPTSGSRLAIALHVDDTNFDPDPANPQQFAAGEAIWTIIGGDSFENLSLSPSVDASAHGHWHGYITNGYIV